MSQMQLAAAAQLSVRAVRDIEHGRVRRVHRGTADRLAEALGLQGHDLRDGDLPGSAAGIRVGVLGALVVRRSGVPVDLRAGKQRLLLGLLALNANREVPTDEIIATLWEAHPPAGCRDLVHGHVSRLRRALRDGSGSSRGSVVGTGRSGYRIDLDDEQLDLLRFDDLAARAWAGGDAEAGLALAEQAMRCWRGPIGDDLPALRGLPVAVAAAHRRRDLAVHAADLALGEGCPGQLVPTLRAISAEEPLHEGVAARLMLALAGSGERAAALAVYDAVRRRLDAQLGVMPSAELKQAHLRVLRQDTSPVTASFPDATPGPAASAPAQLPHDPPGFIGRVRWLSELDAFLAGPDHASGQVMAVVGAAGAGKSALTLQAAHRASARFPDGQLFVDLRGFDPDGDPLSPADVLGRFLRALGLPPERIPGAVDERAALYRSLLSGRRILVLLDNAADAAQVRPLLPGSPSCRTMITSRSALGGLAVREGVTAKTLPVLPLADAIALIDRLLGERHADRDAVLALAHACGRLPLALRIAAGRIAAAPAGSVSALVADMVGERDRLAALSPTGDSRAAMRSVLSWSCRTLPAGSARLFGLLGLLPGPHFGLGVAVALAAAPEHEVRADIHELADRHLLDRTGAERYQLHDLTRLYAVESADRHGVTARAATRRMLTWYPHTADSASAALNAHRERIPLPVPEPACRPLSFSDAADALAWCELERADLLGAHRIAVGLDDHPAGAQLPVALWDFFFLRSYREDWADSHEAALPCARARGDTVVEAATLISLSHVRAELGDHAQARHAAQRALALVRAAGHQVGVGIALHMLGNADLQAGDPESATGRFQEAIAVHRRAGSRWALAWTTSALASTYGARGQHRRARRAAVAALRMRRELGDQFGVGFTLNDLGDIHRRIGSHAQAADYYAQARDACRLTRNRHGEASALHGLGASLARLSDTTARTHLHAAWQLFHAMHDPRAGEVLELLTSLPDGADGQEVMRSSRATTPEPRGPGG